MTHIDLNTTLVTAYHLLGDGQGDEWDHNPEYTRGIVQMVSDLVGVALDPDESVDRGSDGWQPFVLAAIRDAGEREVHPLYLELDGFVIEEGAEYSGATLRHSACSQHICDVEDGDELDTYARLAAAHKCPITTEGASA